MVLVEKVADPSLSDFSLQDWQEWLVDASGESFGFGSYCSSANFGSQKEVH